MAEGKKSFVLYTNYIDLLDGYEEDGEHIDGMTDEEAGKWIKTIFRYVNDREFIIPNEIRQAFILVRKDLKQDLKKYQAKVLSMENARKSNRNHIENKLKPNSNQLEINSDNVNVNDNDNDNVNDNVDIYNDISLIEEESIDKLQDLIQAIEEMFSRCLTNAETITIKDFSKTMSNESIIRDLTLYSDKQNPIAYMKKMIENAKIQEQVKPNNNEGTPQQPQTSGSAWLDNWKKAMNGDAEAEEYLKKH